MGAGLKELVVATSNQNKVREIGKMLDGLGISVLSLQYFPEVEVPPETGKTFAENACSKALAVARATGRLTLADDSGLDVDALGGEPGVMSNRYAGEGASDQEKIEKVLRLMQEVPEGRRQARFRCAMALARPGGEVKMVEGVCQGRLAHAPRGSHGFGYDPIFIPDGLDCTMAELPMEEKNKISHRGRALLQAAEVLKQIWSASA